MTSQQLQCNACVAHIRSVSSFQPQVGIIVGTGLGQLAALVQPETVFDYAELPHFPIPTVETHRGKMLLGSLGGLQVVCLQGRFHAYEGYTMQQVTFPVRVMKALGIHTIFITNICGGLNPGYKAGDLVLIQDHLNLHGTNPLTGPNAEDWGPRFPDMFEAYDQQLLHMAEQLCLQHTIAAHRGVYASVPGPNLETPAEYRYLQTIGADAVGMSTVPEVIAAVHAGLRVFAAGIVTDLCYPPHLKRTNIAEILSVAATAEPKLSLLITQLLSSMSH